MQEPPFRVQPHDPGYTAAAEAEARFWDQPQFFSAEACSGTPGRSPLNRYSNWRLTGDATVRWFETLHHYGSFRAGLFFGCSAIEQEARILELNPTLSCRFMDISEGSLERRQSELARRFPGRVSVERADLNFAVLPEAAYDVIVSSGTLHHLINIERAAHQIKRALRPGGYCFVQDYVMEDRLQFSPTRRALFEALVGRGKARGDLPESTTIRWPEPDAPELSPFEAIRAADTLAVLDGTLQRVSARGAGALTFLLILLRLGDRDALQCDNMGQHMRREKPYSFSRRVRVALGRERRPAMSARFQSELLLLDSVLIDSDVLTPANVFAVYQRRGD